MTNYPTAWQRRALWTVFTYLAIVAAGAVAIALIIAFGQVVGFFQPVLIPFAVAAVLAFLLEPIVRLLTTRTRLKRTGAVLTLFGVIVLGLVLAGVLIVPQIYDSAANMIRGMPEYTQKAQKRITTLIDATEARLAKFNRAVPAPTPGGQEPTPSPTPPPVAEGPGGPAPANAANSGAEDSSSAKPSELLQPNGIRNYIQKQVPTLQSKIPAVLDSVWHLLTRSLGAAGTLIDLIIIPVYLFFLLVESRHIARHWNEYLPLRDSPFKKEVVSALLEINGYLVAFFRGQLIVSTIDGILIGGALAIMGLDFSVFIGLLVVVLTFIPYLGIILCYIPAVLIAIIQYGDFGHPLAVVTIMFLVQMLESTIIAPKIVGDSVGLHPVTVILSVFGWSLLLNGPIGAILAVPLSATVKVLLRRYVWEASGRGRHFVPLSTESMEALKDETRRAEEVTQGKRDADGPRVAGEPAASAPPADKEAPAGPVFVPEGTGKKMGEEA